MSDGEYTTIPKDPEDQDCQDHVEGRKSLAGGSTPVVSLTAKTAAPQLALN